MIAILFNSELHLWVFFILIFLSPVLVYLFYRSWYSLGFKKFRMMFRKKKWTYTVFLDESGNPTFDIKELQREGKDLFFKDFDSMYAFEPIGNGLCIVEVGNALPVVKGGYVLEPTIKTAEKKLKIGEKPDIDEYDKKSNAEQTTKIFRFAYMTGKLKNCLIRPLTKWSSQELRDAIESKVVQEMLHIPTDMMILLLFICMVAVIGITAYFGYTNQQILNEILKELNPYTPT